MAKLVLIFLVIFVAIIASTVVGRWQKPKQTPDKPSTRPPRVKK